MNETEFSLALRARMSDVPVPLDDIVTGALVRGRRLRRRRNAARALSACGALAAAAVVGAIAVGSASNNATPTLDPATEPASTAVPLTHQFGIDAGQTAATLASLLPKGTTSDQVNSDSGSTSAGPNIAIAGGGVVKSLTSGKAAPYRGAKLTFDDGHGAADVEVMVQAPDSDGKPSLATVDLSSALCHQTGITCTVVHGGTLVTESDIPEYSSSSRSTNAAGHKVESSSAIYESDGWSITVTTYNTTDEKGGSVTRTSPPLTTAQLGQIATYAGWLK